MAFILNDEQQVPLTVQPLTAGGRPTVVDGAPVWSTSDPNIVSLVVAADGLSAVAKSVGLGTATVTVVADADLTPAVREISTSIEIQVVPAEAAALLLTAGAPEPKQ